MKVKPIVIDIFACPTCHRTAYRKSIDVYNGKGGEMRRELMHEMGKKIIESLSLERVIKDLEATQLRTKFIKNFLIKVMLFIECSF